VKTFLLEKKMKLTVKMLSPADKVQVIRETVCHSQLVCTAFLMHSSRTNVEY